MFSPSCRVKRQPRRKAIASHCILFFLSRHLQLGDRLGGFRELRRPANGAP